MHALAEARDQSDAAVSSHAASVAATERSLTCVSASVQCRVKSEAEVSKNVHVYILMSIVRACLSVNCVQF